VKHIRVPIVEVMSLFIHLPAARSNYQLGTAEDETFSKSKILFV